MGPFRFRGAAALEIRRREEQAAEGGLVLAEARLSEADRAWKASIDDIGKAVQELERISCQGAQIDVLLWHRNWPWTTRGASGTWPVGGG